MLTAGKNKPPSRQERQVRHSIAESLASLAPWRSNTHIQTVVKMPKPLRIGMIGYGFMGRAHSNAYRRVNNFFPLDYRPVLKAACGRDGTRVKEFADTWGYESNETD